MSQGKEKYVLNFGFWEPGEEASKRHSPPEIYYSKEDAIARFKKKKRKLRSLTSMRIWDCRIELPDGSIEILD